MRQMFILIFLFSFALHSAYGQSDCESEFVRFIQIAQEVTPPIQNHYDPERPISKWIVSLNQIRDRVRGLFQILHEGDYPIIALDDANPVNAYALATDAFQRLPEEQKKLVDIDKIKANLVDLLNRVEAYPENLQKFIDETANLSAEEKLITEYLKSEHDTTFAIQLELPVIQTDGSGKLLIQSRKEYFANDIQLLNTLKRIRRKLRDRNGAIFFGLDEANNLAVSQAISVKRLETYMHELKRALSLNPGKSLPSELQGYLSRIEALYQGKPGELLRAQFRPPFWAIDRLHWMQLGGELRSVFEKDIPRLLDQEQNKKIIQFIHQLSPEERRALGITDAAKALDILSRTKWLSVIPLGSTLGGSLIEGALRGYDYFIADSKAKEHCASLTDDDLFVQCVQEYLEIRFPDQAIWEQFRNQAAFVNDQGQVGDQAVLDEINDVIQRRERLVGRAKFFQNARSQLFEFLKKTMGNHDLSSYWYRRELIELDEETFILRLLGQVKPKIPSYLEFSYPLDFKLYRNQVEKIVNSPYGSELQKEALTSLQKNAPDLADEIKMIIDERNHYKVWGRSGPPSSPSPQPTPSTSPSPHVLDEGKTTGILPWYWFRR